MANDTRYNGWTNYETWAVKLWLDNDEGTYNYWRETAIECWRNPTRNQFINSREDRARITLAERLKDELDNDMPESINDAVNGTMYADLLNAAMSEVNWREIAESMLGDIDDDDKQDDDDDNVTDEAE
jgi:hypothetical protein